MVTFRPLCHAPPSYALTICNTFLYLGTVLNYPRWLAVNNKLFFLSTENGYVQWLLAASAYSFTLLSPTLPAKSEVNIQDASYLFVYLRKLSLMRTSFLWANIPVSYHRATTILRRQSISQHMLEYNCVGISTMDVPPLNGA